MNSRCYLDAALPQIPRILSLQDRNPFSKTYGCFDRDYWLHRTRDFASSIRQMGAHILALVWAHKLQDNPYYQNPKILDWCLASIRYWIRLQHKDGSFDEWYPQERGWAGPTGYLANAMAESYFLLKDVFPQDLKKPFIDAIRRAGHYLVTYNEEFVLANHHAIAILPIYQAYLITGDEELLKGFEQKFLEFEKVCYHEGWCLEYDGADIGYLSGTISFLARLYAHLPDKRIEKIVERGVEFSSYFLYPDGFFGGTIGSRETGHFYHFGYEFWAKEFPLAAKMAEEGLKSLAAQKLVAPSSQEDHYVLYRVAEYLKAYLEHKARPSDMPKLPFEREDFERYFDKAGIFVKKSSKLYCVISLARGGVIKAFDCEKRKIAFNDSGWIAKLGDGRVVTSKWNDPLYRIIYEDSRISVQGQGHYVVTKTFTPLTMVAFRIFLLMFCWNASWAYQVKALIRRLLMVGAKRAPINFKRVISFSRDHLSIEDHFTLDRWTRVNNIYLGDEIPSRYVPQSRYFQAFELDVEGEYLSIADIESLNRDKKFSIFRNPKLFKTE
jgi:hypothetical protein